MSVTDIEQSECADVLRTSESALDENLLNEHSGASEHG